MNTNDLLKRFLVYLIVIGWTIAPLKYPHKLTAKPNTFEQICNLQYRVPDQSRLLQLKHDLALYRQKIKLQGKIRYRQWLFTCHPNLGFTSKIGELENYYKKKGQRVTHYQEFALKANQKILAASLLRLRIAKGKKLFTKEVYFATRAYEYHLHIIPEDNNDPRLAASLINSKETREAIEKTLVTIKFQTAPEITITEANYKWRIRIILILFGLLFLLFVIVLLKKKKIK